MSVHLRIKRLVISGVPLAAAESEELRRALERQLASQWQAGKAGSSAHGVEGQSLSFELPRPAPGEVLSTEQFSEALSRVLETRLRSTPMVATLSGPAPDAVVAPSIVEPPRSLVARPAASTAEPGGEP